MIGHHENFEALRAHIKGLSSALFGWGLNECFSGMINKITGFKGAYYTDDEYVTRIQYYLGISWDAAEDLYYMNDGSRSPRLGISPNQGLFRLANLDQQREAMLRVLDQAEAEEPIVWFP
jgi:hypothetical protein